ncbi:MAG: hypothetical protein Q9226_000483, partial [Calogaya cf. arnoldii]
LQTQISSRQRLESQQQENLAVRKEFNNLSDDSTIYKLIGPVLLKQDKTEAESAVDGRLEFIEKEMYVKTSEQWVGKATDVKGLVYRDHLERPLIRKRVEKLISDMQEQSEGKKMEVSRPERVLVYQY